MKYSLEKYMQPPVGISDFRQLIETKDLQGQPYLYVDKSLFICLPYLNCYLVF